MGLPDSYVDGVPAAEYGKYNSLGFPGGSGDVDDVGEVLGH